jgi:iron complex outermembrane receptor protein
VPFTRNDSLTSWDAGAVYFLTPEISVFAGYASVGYPLLNTEEPQTIGQVPETGTQVETGLRAQVGSWLALSSAIYKSTRKNAFTQITIPNPAGAGNLLVSDNFDYRVYGWDTDFNLHLLDNWMLIGNLSFQNPEITDYPAAPANVGNAVPSAPSFLANLWTTYRLSIPGFAPQLELSAGARFKNHQYSDVAQTRLIPGSAVFDLGAALPFETWAVRIGINNVFDRDYFLHGAGAGSAATPGEGRTFFVKVSKTL